MPPKAAARRPAFNPPRPVKPAAQTSGTTKRAPGPATSRLPPAKKTSTSRSDFLPAAAIISSDEDDDDVEVEESEPDPLSATNNNAAESDIDALMADDAITFSSDEDEDARPAPLAEDTPPIPLPLLGRLLHQNFEDEGTQIQKGAMGLFSTYISIFVQEAIARAKDERGKAGGGAGVEGLLQVEDLERLAPQLVLDF